MAALKAIEPKAPQARELILETLSTFEEGLTADQIAALLDYKVLYARPRVAELHAAKRIERTGERRKNASGLSAAVWRVAA
ncbi:hypothetical protein ACWX0O_01825 [Nitrobacteraceae bacterium UC4449_H16]